MRRISMAVALWVHTGGWVVTIARYDPEVGRNEHWLNSETPMPFVDAMEEAGRIWAGYTDWGDGWLEAELAEWKWVLDGQDSRSRWSSAG